MTPLFKTHFSIGKSLLTPERCFQLAENEDRVVFVEDSFGAFRRVRKLSAKYDKPFIWGININCSYAENKASKVVLFAENSRGIESLREIFTRSKTKSGVWKYDKSSLKNLSLCVPFYNSYIHKSLHNFGVYDLPLDDRVHFVESHHHPYDFQIQQTIDKLGVKTQEVHTICYDKSDHFHDYQFYRATCNRKGGKHPTKGKPELEDCGSNTFSWEHYVGL